MFYESRTKFYLSPELSLLYSAPIPVATLFLFRFIMIICFVAFAFFDMAIFVLSPLIALGIATAASWYYYLFILPTVYLLRVIGASLGSVISMLLVGILPSKWLMRITIGLGFLSIGLWVGIFVFINPMQVFLWLYHWIEEAGRLLFPLTDAVAVLRYLLLGEPAVASWPLARLFLTSAGILAGCTLVTARIYHAGYDRSQTFDVHTRKQVERLAKEPRIRGRGSNVTLDVMLAEWKKAARNYEMAQGSVFFLVILLTYLFVAGGITLPEPWDGLLLLGHIGVIGFLVPLAVSMLFLSADTSEDTKAYLAENYGLLKISPLEGRQFVRCYWFAPFLLHLLVGAVVLLVFNLLIGGNVLTAILSGIVFTLLVGSTGALATAMEIVGFARQGEIINPIGGLLRRILPFIYYIVALGILALGQVYTEFEFLGSLHHLPQEMMTTVSGGIFLALSAFTSYYSLRLGARYWERMEI